MTRTPKERARLLARSSDVAELVRAAESRDVSSLTLDGAFVITLMHQHREVESFVMVEIARGMKAIGMDPGPTPIPRAEGPATKAAAQAPSGRPRVLDFEEQSPADVRRALDALSGTPHGAWLRVRSKSQGERVVHLRVERILARGAEVTVLGTDLDEELGRSFPIAIVVGVRT